MGISLKKKLERLTEQAKNSGEGEFNCLMEFLNDAVADDHGEANKELLSAICDQFIETASIVKTQLNK